MTDQIRSWLETEWALAAAPPVIAGCEFVWVAESPAINADSRTTPAARFSLRGASPQVWRLTEDEIHVVATSSLGHTTGFADAAMAEDYAFRLLPDWLVIADSRKEMPGGHPIRTIGNSAFNELATLRFGGLQQPAHHGPPPVLSIDGLTWRGELDHPRGRFTVSGVFDPTARRGFVLEVRDSGQSGTRVWSSSGWLAHTDGRRYASEVTVTENASIQRTLRFERVESISEDSMRATLALSDFSTTDAIRRDIALRAITDFRPDPPVERHLLADGTIRTVLPYDLHVAQVSRELKVLGWIVAAFHHVHAGHCTTVHDDCVKKGDSIMTSSSSPRFGSARIAVGLFLFLSAGLLGAAARTAVSMGDCTGLQNLLCCSTVQGAYGIWCPPGPFAVTWCDPITNRNNWFKSKTWAEVGWDDQEFTPSGADTACSFRPLSCDASTCKYEPEYELVYCIDFSVPIFPPTCP